ncbi:MAG: DUF6531 domain-containing protein [Acidimicrobiales bacterium]
MATNFNTAALLLTSNERLGCCNIGERQLHLAHVGDPVDPYTGNFFENFTDFAVPGRGPGFGWSRSYNSAQAGVDSPFGFGWTGSYQMAITSDTALAGSASPGVWVWQENGAAIPFYENGSGGYVGPSQATSTLAITDSGTRYTLTRNGTEVIKFSTASGPEYGKVKSIADLAGNTTTFTYDSSGYLTGVTDPAGRSYAVGWNSTSPKHIASVTDPIGRTVSYGYNDSGSVSHLTDVTDVRGQTTHFGYDASHRLTTVTDPVGHTVLTNTYDATTGRVTRQTDALGGHLDLGYNVDVDPPTVPYTTVTDKVGNQTRYEFGVGGLVSKMTRGYGTTDAVSWTYRYDGSTLGVASVTDAAGHTVTTSYDTTAGMVSDVARDGIGGHAKAQYNSYRLATKTTDWNQTDTTLTYGTTYPWRLESATTPISGTDSVTVAYGYDTTHPGDLTTVTDGRSNTWTRHYRADGLVDQISDPMATADVTTVGYDTVGRATWSVAPNGNVSGGTPANYRTATLSDRAGAPLLAVSPVGRGVIDEFGRVDSATSLGSTDTGEAWTAQSGTWGISGGAAYLVSGTNAAATVPVASGDGILVTSVPVAQTGTGVVFRYQDASNYWKLTPDTTGTTWTVTQVVAGATVINATTAAGTCCNPGDAVSVTMAGTAVKVYVNGAQIWSGTSSSLIGAAKVGLWAAGTGGGRIAPVGWSKLGGFTATAYDRDGRPWRVTDGNLNTTTNNYDDAGRVHTVTRADGSVLTTDFDAQGNVTHQKDARTPTAGDTAYTYDHLNRVLTVTDPLGRVTTTSYDNAGNVHTRTSNKPTAAGTYTVTYGYDNANRLTSIGYDAAGPSTPNVAYSYDDNSNRATMVDGSGKYCYHQDKLNRLTDYAFIAGGTTSTSCTGATTTMAWQYDHNDNITQVTYPGSGHNVTKHYDNANRMDWLTDWTSSTHVAFGYDANGQLTSQSRPNNTQAAYTYDTAGAATDIKWTYNTTTTLGEWAYGRDGNEQVTSLTSTGIGTNQTFQYSALNQLNKVDAATYTYDSADNPTNIGRGAITGYDAANQYTTRTTLNTLTYGWDNDGNRNTLAVNGGTPYTFTFNQENQQTAESGVSAYYYNGDRLRTKTNVWTAITNFTWDPTSPVPELAVAGNDYYIYGPNGLVIEAINPTASQQTWFSQDQYQSTRILTANNGAKSGDYTYDPYGNLTSHNTTTITGATSNTPIQWNSQYYDGDSGYYYLRNRVYDPTTGQFISRDPANALTRSAYGYTGGNPLNRTDLKRPGIRGGSIP